MTHNAIHKFLDVMNALVRSAESTSMLTSTSTPSVSITADTLDPRKFNVEVLGSGLIRVWVRMYTSPNATIPMPTAMVNPYQDTNGTLVAECVGAPYSANFELTGMDRSVLVIAWGLFADGNTLTPNSAFYDSGFGTTTTSTTTGTTTTSTSSTTGSTSTSSTTESTSTSTSSTTTDTSSTTESTTTETSSTTAGGPEMLQWTWQAAKGGAKWVLSSPCPAGTKPKEPQFKGKAIGDTTHTRHS